jgi:hypothetical protein
MHEINEMAHNFIAKMKESSFNLSKFSQSDWNNFGFEEVSNDITLF